VSLPDGDVVGGWGGAAAHVAAPVLKLAATPTEVYALLGGGEPSLWRTAVDREAWSRVLIDADIETVLADADADTTSPSVGDGALSSLTDGHLRRLLLPSRFAPRHLAAAQQALLPESSALAFDAASAASVRAAYPLLRAGIDARILELERNAAAGGAAPADIECTLGDSLLSYAISQKSNPHEILALEQDGGGGA
jgi:hypothetical protein